MRRACIVGGGSALAQGIIRHYLTAGWEVIAVCRHHSPAEIDPDSRLKIVWSESQLLAATEEKLDLVVTLSGATNNAKLGKMEEHQWQEVIDACLGSVWEALNLLSLRIADGGSVVVVGSVIGSIGGFGCANYAAAKAGLVGLVRAAANEWAGRRICVNLLELGYCDAGMGSRLEPKVREKVLATIPLGRFASPDEVTAAVVYLGATKYMTGNVLTLAGGLR